MAQRTDHCPACGRPFKSILDYPLVRVLAFERLPLPEVVDYLSPAAATKTMKRRRESFDPSTWEPDGINRTPQIARACDTPEVRNFLARLATMSGQEMEPRGLLPRSKLLDDSSGHTQ